MSDIFYVNSSPNWTINTANSTMPALNVFNVNDRNFSGQYTITGAVGASLKLVIDRGAVPASGSNGGQIPITHIGIQMHSGSYTNWATGNPDWHIYQSAMPHTGWQFCGTGVIGPSRLDASTGLYMQTLSTRSITHRYVRISAVQMQVNPTITEIMLLSKQDVGKNYTITNSNQYTRWYTKSALLDGHTSLKSSNFRHPINVFSRSYPLRNFYVGVGQNIVNYSRGSLEPFVYQDGLTSKKYLCRFTKDEADVQYVETTDFVIQKMDFEEIYHINPGYTV